MGRITDCTPDLIERLAGLIRAGNYFETACDFLGIEKRSAYNWLTWGKEGKDAHGPNPDLYRQFFHAFVQAEAEAEVGAVASLKQAGRPHKLPKDLVDEDGKPLPGVQYGDWRATAEYLARRHRDRWSPNARTEVVGSGGGPVQVETKSSLAVLADPAACELANALIARISGGEEQIADEAEPTDSATEG
jgi:hypothetical protein